MTDLKNDEEICTWWQKCADEFYGLALLDGAITLYQAYIIAGMYEEGPFMLTSTTRRVKNNLVNKGWCMSPHVIGAAVDIDVLPLLPMSENVKANQRVAVILSEDSPRGLHVFSRRYKYRFIHVDTAGEVACNMSSIFKANINGLPSWKQDYVISHLKRYYKLGGLK